MERRTVATKAEWLRLQEETRQRQIVTVNQALALAPSLYFGTRRCTYSDVLSVVTTVRPLPQLVQDAPMPLPLASNVYKKPLTMSPWRAAATAKQPATRRVEETLSNGSSSRYIEAPLESDSERSKRFLARQMYALTQERSAFMDALQTRRRQRFLLENGAALVVQRVYRGFLLRRRFVAIKEKLRVRKRIRVNLVKVAKGTAIITGERERKARLLEQRHAAAHAIQCAFWRWRGRLLLQRERSIQIDERRHRAAKLLQRVWRRALALSAVRKLRARFLDQQRQRVAELVVRLFLGFQARQRVRRIRLRRQTRASQRIQNVVACFHARKALELQRRRRCDERCHKAATTIQRSARGALARERVVAMRIQEDRAIRVACALSIQRVFRGFCGRRRMRFHWIFHVHSRAHACAVQLTRIVRGFLCRQRAKLEKLDQETDLLVQTIQGNTSTVIDLLDGYGLVDEPVELTTTNYTTKNTMLHLAARHGRMEILTHVLPKFLQQAPQLIYATNANGETPLELAITNGHEKLASFLLTKTADLFVETAFSLHQRKLYGGRHERSLVLEAARHGMGAIAVKLVVLFPQFFDGKERDAWTQRALLHEALLLPRDRYEDSKTTSVSNEIISVALRTMLTKLPVDVNARDLVGFTPLHVAAMLGNLTAVRLLLESGADVALTDREGRSPWRLALLYGHEACLVEIKRKWLSDVAISSSGSGSSLDGGPSDADVARALASATAKSQRDPEDLHPHLAKDLIQAARRSENDRVRMLLEQFHANVNARDPDGDGDSLLMVVLHEKNLKLLRHLLDNYQDELDGRYVNKNGRSVMDVALQSPVLVKMLIHSGLVNPCLPLDTTKLHRSTCHEAVRRGYDLRAWIRGYTFMPTMLVPLVDDAGHTPLHDAAAFGNFAALSLLVNAGLRVDQRDTVEQRTPLHEACRSGDLAMVRKLVSAGPHALWICDAAGHLPMMNVASSSAELISFVLDRMRSGLGGDGQNGTLDRLASWLREADETRRENGKELGIKLQREYDQKRKESATGHHGLTVGN